MKRYQYFLTVAFIVAVCCSFSTTSGVQMSDYLKIEVQHYDKEAIPDYKGGKVFGDDEEEREAENEEEDCQGCA